MDGKMSINAAVMAKSAEVSLSMDGSAKKSEMPAQVEGIKLPPAYNERLAEILHGFGLKASEENISILRLLYENGFGLTKENFFKMNHALKLTGSSDKALFMYENNMKMTAANLAVLDGIVSGKTKIIQQLASLAEAINEVKDPVVKSKLNEVFAREKEALEELLPKTQSTASQAGKQAAATTPVFVEKLTAQAAAHQINIAYLGKFMPSNTESLASAGVAEKPANAGTTDKPANAGAEVNTSSTVAVENNTKTAAQEGGINKEAAPINEAKAALVLQLGDIKVPVVKQVSYESLVNEAKPQNQDEASNIQMPPRPIEIATQPSVLGEVAANETIVEKQPAPGQSRFAIKPQQSPQAPGIPVFNNLLFRPAESNPLEISRYIESLRIRLVEIIQTLRENPDPATNRVVQAAREILNHIDFSSQVRNQIYVQLPYVMGNGQADVSLYVFKDAKKATASDGRGVSSAFLSLETSNLGLFEAYVQKKDKSIHLQFRLKNEETINLVRENIAKLDTLLGEHDLSLSSYNFTKSDEAFTVLDKPEKLSEESSATILAGDEIPQFDELV